MSSRILKLGALADNVRNRWMRIERRWNWPRHEREIESSLEWLHGSRAAAGGVDGVVVVCVARNAEEHVNGFLRHHLGLGAAHVVLLDNGSEDGTVAQARLWDRVTVLRSALPFRTHKHALRRYLVERFGGRGWVLMCDVDERFDFPFSDRLALPGFARYLDREGYTAVTALLLDLFAGGPVRAWPRSGPALLEECRWYDLSDVYREELPREMRDSELPPGGIPVFRGGIRLGVFGVRAILTKFPMTSRGGRKPPVLEDAHFCSRARVADVSGVLLHYKFDGAFRENCVRAVREQSHHGRSAAYRRFLQRLEADPDLSLRRPSARLYRGVDDLIGQGFVRVSESYRRFARQGGGDPAGKGDAK